MADIVQLTKQQQRVLKLVFKFRFINTPLLANVLGFRRYSVYQVLEILVAKELLVKVYEQKWRIIGKPAYYYLSKKGVTTVRKLLDIDEKFVNTAYNDNKARPEFIEECLATLTCYIPLKQQLPPDTIIRTKTELNRYNVFPKHKPDLYIITPHKQEAFIFVVPDKLPYFVNKLRDEYLDHSDEEGWKGRYPTLAFVVKDNSSKMGLLYKAQKKLEDMGYDEDELTILATHVDQLISSKGQGWGNAINPTKYVSLFG